MLDTGNRINMYCSQQFCNHTDLCMQECCFSVQCKRGLKTGGKMEVAVFLSCYHLHCNCKQANQSAIHANWNADFHSG